ncbi:MAG: ribonuclease PH, partial [Alphaproteobacteria bacterium]|nr:ribonuclease PH [Alphaproteobacteria bacterium]
MVTANSNSNTPTPPVAPKRDKRSNSSLRPVMMELAANRYAEGSCLISFGETQVLCTATLEDGLPSFLRGKGQGWITAEYGMLPRATHQRNDREAVKGKQSGRTQEIQRLIGRSLRAVTDLKKLGERQIRIDCDVLQADGGTRTAAITGAYIALDMACRQLIHRQLIQQWPLLGSVAAVSVGLVNGELRLDLDYGEDSNAAVDGNFVKTAANQWLETQVTAENGTFSQEQLIAMLDLAS